MSLTALQRPLSLTVHPPREAAKAGMVSNSRFGIPEADYTEVVPPDAGNKRFSREMEGRALSRPPFESQNEKCWGIIVFSRFSFK